MTVERCASCNTNARTSNSSADAPKPMKNTLGAGESSTCGVALTASRMAIWARSVSVP